ncbi:MAG: N-acetylmuramoyl-L-alanine amidase [Deltaproteobacteria bacterium]|nr:N-acetylmuramoyl-L-alanine amidase [Deltaproteobacteria bacterium]
MKKFVFLLTIAILTITGQSGISNTDSLSGTDADTGAPSETDTPTELIDSAQTAPTPESPASAPVICLSPGHPSLEGDKYYEAIINRKVAWFLTILLLEADFNVVLAVNDVPPDNLFFANLSNEDDALWSDLQVMPPEEKANRCNDAGADYLISIHHNFAYSPTMNETMVFYTVDDNYRPRHTEVIPWAENTASYLGKVMETDDEYAIADMERIGFQLGVLSNAEMPGILTEASFYSNPDERARLNDDLYLEKEAEAIFRAFVDTFVRGHQSPTQ